MTTTARHYALGYTNVRTYLFAALFILGNLILPRFFHAIPSGGMIFLPIYFFTLIGAYRYGLWVGLLTAVFSPLLNHWLFGMPSEVMLPVILCKSLLLATAASFAARKSMKLTVWTLLGVVLFYQLAGALAEWALLKDISLALNSLRIGIPGMIIQVLGGYLVLRSLSRW